MLRLTQMYEPTIEAQAAQTFAGMAHFAGSGPAGLRCRDCKFFGYEVPRLNNFGEVVGTARKPGCGMFYQLTQRHGPKFPGNTLSCRHIEVRA
jgi:hypothetical protein